MTVKEAAAQAGLTVQQMNRQIKLGILKATYDIPNKRHEISEGDFALWQATRRKVGRPRLMNRES